MRSPLLVVAVVLCFHTAEFSDAEDCVIELECEECLPEKMPAVTSHGARAAVVRVPHGEHATLSCGDGHFQLYERSALSVRCEAGRWRAAADGALRPLLQLGCRHHVLEDVRHAVAHCAPPLQGRAYVSRAAPAARHLATLCVDADRALAVHARVGGAPLAPHDDARAPLSILGNFEDMFDASTRLAAERLFASEARLGRRLRELFKHERYAFAGQALTAGRLLAPGYFPPQDGRAAEFVSNKVLSWRSVVEGNLRHVHEDVAAAMSRDASLDVYAGTHGVLSLAAGAVGGARSELYLGADGRFPVPRYMWTAVVAAGRGRGVALVLLNDPFVTVSEIREAVFCASACGELAWAARLAAHRNYERPLLGLVFCCSLPEFAARVTEMPRVFNYTVQLLDNI